MADIETLLCNALERHLSTGERPRLPAGGELLWQWFIDLSNERQWQTASPQPIGHEAIAAYFDLAGLRGAIRWRHVQIITALDRTYRAKVMARGNVAAGPPMSGELFDRLFG